MDTSLNKVIFKPATDNLPIMLIAAIGNDFAIGQNGQMPWHLPEDLKHFKDKTSQKCVIMGRRTFESIGRLLPNRRNIVISRNANLPQPPKSTNASFELVNSLEQALQLANNKAINCNGEYVDSYVESDIVHSYEQIAIIGGAHLYNASLGLASILEITHIGANFAEADTFFPDFTVDKSWHITTQTPEQGYFFSSKEEQPAFKQEFVVPNAHSLPYRFVSYQRHSQ